MSDATTSTRDTLRKATPREFSAAQKALHWAVVGLIALQYLLFDRMGGAFRTLMQEGVTPWNVTTIAHVAIGVAVLALAVWRVALRLTRGAPPAPEGEPALAQKAGALAHWALYGLLFALPLSGLAAWFGQIGSAAGLHEILTTALLWLAGLHVLAVAVHQFWWRTGLLGRMLRN